MGTSEDIGKHLFYSIWVLMIVQILSTVGSGLLAGIYPDILIGIQVAFDCALALFAIGILRSGNENKTIKYWLPTGILLLIAPAVDIILIILSYIYRGEQWSLTPFIYIRLGFLIVYYLIILIAFFLSKFFIDSLLEHNQVNKKSDLLVFIGYIVILMPALTTWFHDYFYPRVLETWLINLAFGLYLLSAFLVLLGFFQMASNFNMLKSKEALEKFRKETSLMLEDEKVH